MTTIVDFPAAATSARPRTSADVRVGVWLACVAALVLCMIIVGGATRLTDSGLSITEWAPIHGVIPPLNEAQWQEEFARYREIPEYQLQNRGMSLAEFQFIYWWEWAHRLLGRVIGLAVFVPLVVFLALRQVRAGLAPWLWSLFALGGLQGAIGWWMVASGLSGDRLDVAAYRLATHLGLAFILFSMTVWLAHDLLKPRARNAGDSALLVPGLCFLALLFTQIILGAFVAGTDAGFRYNDWPTIGGHWLPQAYADLAPFWRNWVENHEAIQFNHRIGAYLVMAASFALALAASRSPDRAVRVAGWVVFGLCMAQGALGVVTLLSYGIWTPPHVAGVLIGIGHQALGAIVLAAAALFVRAARPART